MRHRETPSTHSSNAICSSTDMFDKLVLPALERNASTSAEASAELKSDATLSFRRRHDGSKCFHVAYPDLKSSLF